MFEEEGSEKSTDDSDENREQPAKRESRPRREIRQPKYLSDYQLTTNVDYAYNVVPSMSKTYEEAISSQDAEKWKAAMNNEIKTLKEAYFKTILDGRAKVLA